MSALKKDVLKRFYFVRHGQTKDNASNVYQSKDDELNENGRKQATLVAERFAAITADVIISSDFNRALETAEALVGSTGLPLIESPLFEEIRRPSDLIGQDKKLPSSKLIMDEIIENELRKDWHHTDEENLFEAIARAREALEYLCRRPEERIVVVAHEMFIKMLLAGMAVEDDENAIKFYRMMRYFMIGDNTGITIAEYGNFPNGNKFRLRIWNDHAHLG